jgi:hypothetical protein
MTLCSGCLQKGDPSNATRVSGKKVIHLLDRAVFGPPVSVKKAS